MKFAYLIEPPFNDRSADGTVTGCDVELALHVFESLGFSEPALIEASFAELLPGLTEGRWRMTTGLFGTPERQSAASFSRPIWALPDGLLVAADNPLNLDGYRAVAQRPGCTLAVIRDQFQHRSAVAWGVTDERLRIYETYTEAAAAVRDGDADAYASVERAHTGFLEQNPGWNLDVVRVPPAEKKPAFGSFAVAKDDECLLGPLNEVLDGYIGSPEHRRMMARYGFDDSEIDLLVA